MARMMPTRKRREELIKGYHIPGQARKPFITSIPTPVREPGGTESTCGRGPW